MSRATITLDGVGFSYAEGGWRLSVPQLQVGKERTVCIVGPNGSGKSTLLRVAAGILPPVDGTVCIDGNPLARMARRAVARRIGFLPQESPPLFDCSVEAAAHMGRYAHSGWFGASTRADRQAVDKALAAVDMEALRDRPLSQLSGGERRRAMIASVLAQEPALFLLDEPTASLDIHHAAAVMRLLSGFAPDGPAVVVVTHDINMASLFADRLLLLVRGRIRADGAPSAVVREDTMRRAYGENLIVKPHPEAGVPMVAARR